MNNTNNKGKFDWKIPFSIFLLFMNQIFTFIGGVMFIKTLFHVPTFIGIGLMALFYIITFYMVYNV